MGRLYCKLHADEALGRLLLPLLADLLLRGSTSSTSRSSSNTTVGGSSSSNGNSSSAAAAGDNNLGYPFLLGTVVSAVGGGGQGSDAAGLHHDHDGCTASVAAAVVCALQGMASACVQQQRSDRDAWLYNQALQLLLMLYREPTPVGGAAARVDAVLLACIQLPMCTQPQTLSLSLSLSLFLLIVSCLNTPA